MTYFKCNIDTVLFGCTPVKLFFLHTYVILDFFHFAVMIIRHQKVAFGVHTYTEWCVQTTVVNVAKEMSILVYDMDIAVVNVCYQNPTPNVGSDTSRTKCLQCN